MENITTLLNEYITNYPLLSFGIAFSGGLLTALNPCVLAMIPLMIGFVMGRKETSGIKSAFLYSFLFVIGLSITFSILGIVAAILGQIYGETSKIWNYIVFGVCILMGIQLLGIYEFPFPSLNIKKNITGGIGAFLMGLVFGFVSTPCAVPILLVILTYIAATHSSIAYGAGLLLSFSLGHSVLILIAGTSVGMAQKIIESKKIQTINFLLRKIAGGLIILVGLYFFINAII